MQGSITHLQAEIRRLKEIIEKGGAGGGGGGGEASGESAKTTEIQCDGDGAKYQKFFVQAMILRQQCDADRKVGRINKYYKNKFVIIFAHLLFLYVCIL